MAFDELKQRLSFVWGAAPFENMEPEIAVMHDDLVARLAPRAGERWADLGCGPGAVAMRAARAGAEVTGLDLAPGLIEAANRRASEEGLAIEYLVGDCEQLPFEDASFDAVSSSVGVIFGPDQEAVAAELARVCKPGGRLGLTAWQPNTGMEGFFALIARFQPPPPEGVGDPLDWGRPEHARELLGEDFELDFAEGDAPQRGESGEAIWQLFRANVGPAKVLYESLDADRAEELHRAAVDFYEEHRSGDRISQSRPYLVVLGTRR